MMGEIVLDLLLLGLAVAGLWLVFLGMFLGWCIWRRK